MKWLAFVALRLKEPLIRLMASPSKPYDGNVLTTLFDKTFEGDLDQCELSEAIYTKGIRWAIANTIAEARPTGISDWILEKLESQTLGESKKMLLIAGGRLCPSA